MLGTKLKELRAQKGITQESMAKSLGVSAQAISKWEQNITSPDISLLVPIVDFFGVSLDFLLRNESNSESIKADEIVEITIEPDDRHWIVHTKNISPHEIKELVIKAYFYDANNNVIEHSRRNIFDLEPGMAFPVRFFATDEKEVTHISVVPKKCVLRH